jgi:predicted chitinase
MTMSDLTFTPERWQQFWRRFKGEPQQLAGIEELRQAIAQSDPALLTESASWVANFHKEQPRPAGLITPELMHRLTGYRAAAFDQHFCDDFNRLLKESGFDQHPAAQAMLIANILHETGGTLYFKELASGEAYNNRADLGNGPDDGRRFRGAGCLQLTGRYNYSRLAKALGDERVMEGCDYVADAYPFMSALPWIQENHLLDVCLNQGFDAACKCINGGWTGIEDRRNWYTKVSKELGA